MVSVIIPTYGGGEGLDRTIDSILTQTYPDIEIIVVDDNGCASQNQIRTANVLQKYLDENKIKYLTPKNNGGGSAARNRGAAVAKGQYLMFLDDDDTVSPDKIAKQVAALDALPETYAISYVSSKIYANNTLSNIIWARKSGSVLYEFLLNRIYMGTGTVLLRREAYDAVGGYDESFVRHQDWEFLARVLNHYQCAAVKDAYFNRFITNRNISANVALAEKYMDHYIAFLKTFPFSLSKHQMRKVVNYNNAKIALQYLKERDFTNFLRVLHKYDRIISAGWHFAMFAFAAIWDKAFGKKS